MKTKIQIKTLMGSPLFEFESDYNSIKRTLQRAVGEGYLKVADLDPIKNDLFEIFNTVPNEVKGFQEKLKEGQVDGSVYQGDCACLVGTIANIKGCKYDAIPGLEPNSDRPAERWFLAIGKGHTPDNNFVAKITNDWIEEYLTK